MIFLCYIMLRIKEMCLWQQFLWDVTLWNIHFWLRKHRHSMSCTFTSQELLFQPIIVFTDRILHDTEICHKALTASNSVNTASWNQNRHFPMYNLQFPCDYFGSVCIAPTLARRRCLLCWLYIPARVVSTALRDSHDGQQLTSLSTFPSSISDDYLQT